MMLISPLVWRSRTYWLCPAVPTCVASISHRLLNTLVLIGAQCPDHETAIGFIFQLQIVDECIFNILRRRVVIELIANWLRWAANGVVNIG